MGKLIQDFWTYEYKNRQYYGIVEVVKGDLKYRKLDGKFETHIEAAINYLKKPNHKILSHMSLQSYCGFMKDGQAFRGEKEETYYPFCLEFEPHLKPGDFNFKARYKDAADELYRTVLLLEYEFGVNREDMLITMTNSRSFYLFVNPKSYGLKPSCRLHQIYKKMFELLSDYIDFIYVDKSHFRHQGLIKTPGSYYAGGYVVPVTLEEIKTLMHNPDLKDVYTMQQKSLRKSVPGAFSNKLHELYQEAVEIDGAHSAKLANSAKKIALPVRSMTQRHCIKQIEANGVKIGERNYALVSLGIAYKEAGYSETQTLDMLLEKANAWQHDENAAIIASKVRLIYKKDYVFSCQYAKEHIQICNACTNCKHQKNARGLAVTKFKIYRSDVIALRKKKLSKRHYEAYLTLSRYDLYNKRFELEDYGLKMRTIRELCSVLDIERDISYTSIVLKRKSKPDRPYLLPNEFYDNGVYVTLDEHIKHYLVLYVKFGYKSYGRYAMMRVGYQKIKNTLGYKSDSGLYKFLSKLKLLGLIVYKKKIIHALYFESKKIIDFEKEKIRRSVKKQKRKLRVSGDKIDYSNTHYNLEGDRGSP